MNLKKLVLDYKDLVLKDPFTATDCGVHTKDLEVSDLSKKRIMDDLKTAKDLLKKSEKINAKKLSFDENIDLELLQLNLKGIIFHSTLKYNGMYDWEQKPNLGGTLMNGFMYLFLKDPRSHKIRLDAVTARFGKIPSMIGPYRKVIKRPVKQWKQREIEELKEIPDLFNNILAWAKKEKYKKTKLLQENIEKTMRAIEEYVVFLENLPTGDQFNIDKKKMEELIRLNGIDYSVDKIHEISKQFFIDYDRKVNILVGRLRKKYNLKSDMPADQIITFIKEKNLVPIDEVVDKYKSEQARILEFLKKSRLFVLPKSDKLLILRTPKYLYPSIPVGAMFPPAPFEKGPKTSISYLTIDEGRQKDQNKLMITNTMIHEGLPGHHMQFSIAYENKSIVRRLSNYNSHAEGWTTYLEEYMIECGFIGDDIKDEYALISLADFARLGARVAIDLYFMTGEEKYLEVINGFKPQGKDAVEKAKALLIKATGFSDARADGEVGWYSRSRGYPMCYLLGNIMTNELRNEMIEKIQNRDKAVREFHKIYLTEGIMPLPFLKKVIKKKIFRE